MMEMIVVKKRLIGERHDVREFVQPNSVMVQELAARLSMGGDFTTNCYNWVKEHIKYPPGTAAAVDWHRIEAFVSPGLFGRRPMIQQDVYDFWQYPAETIALGAGDCEDMSILLCSLLRTRLPEDSVFVTIGDYSGSGHSWVVVRERVYDAANDRISGNPVERPPYRPWFRFNDRIIMEGR